MTCPFWTKCQTPFPDGRHPHAIRSVTHRQSALRSKVPARRIEASIQLQAAGDRAVVDPFGGVVATVVHPITRLRLQAAQRRLCVLWLVVPALAAIVEAAEKVLQSSTRNRLLRS